MQQAIKNGISQEQYDNMMYKLESKNIVSLESTEGYSNFSQQSDWIKQKINSKKIVIPLVNSISRKSSFNYSQLEFIKAYGGKYDSKTEYWYLEVL